MAIDPFGEGLKSQNPSGLFLKVAWPLHQSKGFRSENLSLETEWLSISVTQVRFLVTRCRYFSVLEMKQYVHRLPSIKFIWLISYCQRSHRSKFLITGLFLLPVLLSAPTLSLMVKYLVFVTLEYYHPHWNRETCSMVAFSTLWII